MKGWWALSKAFLASVEMIMWCLSLSLFVWGTRSVFRQNLLFVSLILCFVLIICISLHSTLIIVTSLLLFCFYRTLKYITIIRLCSVSDFLLVIHLFIYLFVIFNLYGCFAHMYFSAPVCAMPVEPRTGNQIP